MLFFHSCINVVVVVINIVIVVVIAVVVVIVDIFFSHNPKIEICAFLKAPELGGFLSFVSTRGP